jgi:SAM-dependent methyltransferase
VDETSRAAAVAWDAEYRTGRYEHEPPVGFLADVLAAARAGGLGSAAGLYLGCGNGRNYLPLVEAGLDLVGLDVSLVALERLARRAPDRRQRLVHGTLDALPAGQTYPIVIGIQVFQHGDRDGTHALLRQAQRRLAPNGLFCLRVNAVGTDVWPDHEVTEQAGDGGFTVRYLAGPKAGLLIHFFARPELTALFADGFVPVLAPRLDRTVRTPPQPGQWTQWEAIWRRTTT